MFQDELNRFRERMPSVDYCSLRVVDEQMDVLTVRRDVLQPIELEQSGWNGHGSPSGRYGLRSDAGSQRRWYRAGLQRARLGPSRRLTWRSSIFLLWKCRMQWVDIQLQWSALGRLRDWLTKSICCSGYPNPFHRRPHCGLACVFDEYTVQHGDRHFDGWGSASSL